MRKHLLAFGLALAFPTDASAGEVYGPPEPKPFILPEPDPLVEALDKMLRRRTMHPDREVLADEAAFLTAELAARGWKMNLERIEQ